MPKLAATLALDRCPHCGIAKPHLQRHWNQQHGMRYWSAYVCSVCQGAVLADAAGENQEMRACYPSATMVAVQVPDRPRTYLQQAQDSLAQPAGSLMLSASAVDSMLKLKGLREGSLYVRIDEAAKAHIITSDMAKWAHQVRL